jgi:uncharacterized protein (TIGR02246 family)
MAVWSRRCINPDQAQERKDVNEAENPVTHMLRAYKTAVLAKDADAFVALYDEDVCVFDMWGRWSYAGVEAWRSMVQGWFASLGADSVFVETDELEISVAGGVAVAHALIGYRNVPANGDEERSMLNRVTWVLRQHGGAWKIVHEHTSAPIDFETSKVILRR